MKEKNEIWITGLGIISSIGKNLSECEDSLKEMKSGIKPIKKLNTIHKNDYVAGEVELSNSELSNESDIKKQLPRTALLALKAAKEAMESAVFKEKGKARVGIILGTTVGGMDKTEELYKRKGNPGEYIPMHHCGFTTSYLAKYFDINDYVNTISTACSSSANAIMLGARLIKNGILDAVLAGGSDALSSFTLNGFRSLMILDPEPCKPFSAERRGLNLGEGAGFVFLESKKTAQNRNAKGFCKVSGYANTNDAFHQTASSPDGRGAYKAMYEALISAELDPDKIDYINIHGTGTDNNDLTESIAIIRLFKEGIPDLSSTKAYTGHCLGAAGSIEAIFSVLSITNGALYPNLRFTNPIPETGLIPVMEYKEKKIRHVLSNSFGFGGCDTSLIFSAIE